MEKDSGVLSDQTNHNIPLDQRPIQSKTLILLHSMKAEKSEEVAEEKFEASRFWFMKFKTNHHLHNIGVQGEAEVLIEETEYYKDPDKINLEGGLH